MQELTYRAMIALPAQSAGRALLDNILLNVDGTPIQTEPDLDRLKEWR